MAKKKKELIRHGYGNEMRKKFGIVYTPDFVVDKTLDLAFKYLPVGSDPLSLTWCDPACGDGNFLVNLYYRLMACPSVLDPVAKSEHILTKCIFGAEILKTPFEKCKKRLTEAHVKTVVNAGGSVEEAEKIYEKLINIKWGDAVMAQEDVGKWDKFCDEEGGIIDWGSNEV